MVHHHSEYKYHSDDYTTTKDFIQQALIRKGPYEDLYVLNIEK